MTRFRLPVSGSVVELRPPSGADDLLLAESPRADWSLATNLLDRLAPLATADVAGGAGWAHQSLTDCDAVLLELRRNIAGDRILTDTVCTTGTCGRRIDVGFRISDLLSHRRIRKPPGVEPSDEAGWYRMDVCEFRLPTPHDLLGLSNPTRSELADLCVRPDRIRGLRLARIESAMDAVSPSLSGDLKVRCPECGTDLDVYFDALVYVLEELRARAAGVYADIHLLAWAYHWPEGEIIALSSIRRARYVALVGDAFMSIA